MRKLAIGLIVLALLWSGGWYVLSIVAGGRFDDIITREADRGRRIACTERSVAGFPFAFRVSCKSFAFEAVAPLRPIAFKSGAGEAGVSLGDPLKMVLTLQAPFELRTPNGAPVTLDWRQARLRVGYSWNGVQDARVEIDDLKLAAPERGVDGVAATKLVLTAARAAKRPPEDAALDIALRLEGLVTPALDRLARNPAPAELSLDLVVTATGGLVGLPPPLALDRWRRAGGQIDIGRLDVGKGELKLEATGNLALDEEHRPRGRIAGAGRGLAFLQSAPANRVGDLAARVGAAAGNLKIPFALTMENGQARLGPIRLGDLPPLY